MKKYVSDISAASFFLFDNESTIDDDIDPTRIINGPNAGLYFPNRIWLET
jgi:hypothetical protein